MTGTSSAQNTMEWAEGPLRIIDAGRVSYAHGLELQAAAHARVLALRDADAVRVGGSTSRPTREVGDVVGEVFLLEHDPPVITVSRRPGARANLLATDAALREAGVEVAETDRGGDITYHGPGQLVAYPILDLQRIGWNLHGYMRALEEAVIRACAAFGVVAERDASATGVWVGGAKVCAMGVRVRRWVSMHGLALNVTTNLAHFDLIVPCGLAGRTVTNMERELGPRRPSMDVAKRAVAREFGAVVAEALRAPRDR